MQSQQGMPTWTSPRREVHLRLGFSKKNGLRGNVSRVDLTDSASQTYVPRASVCSTLLRRWLSASRKNVKRVRLETSSCRASVGAESAQTGLGILSRCGSCRDLSLARRVMIAALTFCQAGKFIFNTPRNRRRCT